MLILGCPFAVWIVVLVSTFGLAALTIWGIGHRNPEWSEWWAGDDSSGFAVLGKQSTPSGTEVQSRLDDDEFFVYVGFIIWITTLIAGVGMEALVWMYFIRVWSVERERYWRFAQFFFPLLAMTALGLALYQNYLSLPVMVFGLWKVRFKWLGRAFKISRIILRLASPMIYTPLVRIPRDFDVHLFGYLWAARSHWSSFRLLEWCRNCRSSRFSCLHHRNAHGRGHTAIATSYFPHSVSILFAASEMNRWFPQLALSNSQILRLAPLQYFDYATLGGTDCVQFSSIV